VRKEFLTNQTTTPNNEMVEMNAGHTNENEASARNLLDTIYLDPKQLIHVD